MKFRFLGEPDYIFPNLVTGKIYDLKIAVETKGFFIKTEYPVITSPIRCPYSSWDTFYLNWERVR